jgi:hypothetical protein
MLGAEQVQRLAARRAEPVLQAAGGIIKAGMDHLAAARAGLRPDLRAGLQDQHLASGAGECAPDRQPDHAGAHHHAFDIGHACRARV